MHLHAQDHSSIYLYIYIYIYIYYQSEGLTERTNEPPWGRCLQGAVDARWVVVVVVVVVGVVVVASQGGRHSPPAELYVVPLGFLGPMVKLPWD